MRQPVEYRRAERNPNPLNLHHMVFGFFIWIFGTTFAYCIVKRKPRKSLLQSINEAIARYFDRRR